MLGIIISLIAIYTTLKFLIFGDGLWILALIASLYEISSYINMMREVMGIEKEDKAQTFINLISSIVIIVLFIYSFFLL